MNVNRELQREILKYAKDQYPDFAEGKKIDAIYYECFPPEDETYEGDFDRITGDKELIGNLNYLEEHGLIIHFEELGFTPTIKITAKGIDFLEDDGGLSAILRTVTVKFDAQNLRELVAAGLLPHVPEEKKGIVREALSKASGTVLQTAVAKMVEKGMSDPMGTVKAVAGMLGLTLNFLP